MKIRAHHSLRKAGLATTMTVAVVFATVGLTSSPAAAVEPPAPTGAISGTVRSIAGSLPGMLVYVARANEPTLFAETVTLSDGTFTLNNLPPDNYKLAVADQAQYAGAANFYVAEFYDNAGTTLEDFANATVITVASGATTTLNTITLDYNNPGSISGSVRSIRGPIANMVVVVSPTAEPMPIANAVTSASGSFTITGLPPGEYKAAILDPTQLQGAQHYWVSELYNNSGDMDPDWDTATPIAVSAATTTWISPVTLEHNHPGTISGKVMTQAGNKPIAGMTVLLSRADNLYIAASVTTLANGSFAASGLPPGTYKVLTIDPAQGQGAAHYYIAEFYNDAATSFSSATTINVTPSSNKVLQNIKLVRR